MTSLRLFTPVLQGLILLLASWQLQALELRNPDTALQDYIQYDDGNFNIQPVAALPGAGFTAYLYQLTSQRWLTDTEVDRSLWTHTLVTIIPDTVTSTTSMLFVGDDDNDDPLPDENNPVIQIITQLALGSQSIVSAVFQVPNQPITFLDDGIARKEDKLTSISWKKALDTGNYVYTAYLPMAKTVVKAMDGVQSVIGDLGDYQINDFVLTGFSKRGAAVWLAAAVDPRVKAIAPGVIDILNIAPSFEHHFKSYGEYSSAVEEYVNLGILQKLRSPEFADLAKVIDPYAYRDQLTMPKLILNSSGDQFFLPDSAQFYLDDLVGETLIRFAPNTDHSLSNSATSILDSLYSLLGWYQTVLYGAPRPTINWQLENGELVASTSIPPAAVKVWSAYNPNGRDFRKDTIGETWSSTLITPDASHQYTVSLPESNSGFHATYIEFIYQGLAGLPMTYSTEIYVTPDSYPYVLDNPVLDPKPAHYWKRQVKNILRHKAADVDEITLTGYLPIPLFDNIVADINAVFDALSLRHFNSFDDLADRECMATRLNIAANEMGWYSMRDLGTHLGNRPLWQHYAMADNYVENLPMLSSYICHQLNR